MYQAPHCRWKPGKAMKWLFWGLVTRLSIINSKLWQITSTCAWLLVASQIVGRMCHTLPHSWGLVPNWWRRCCLRARNWRRLWTLASSLNLNWRFGTRRSVCKGLVRWWFWGFCTWWSLLFRWFYTLTTPHFSRKQSSSWYRWFLTCWRWHFCRHFWRERGREGFREWFWEGRFRPFLWSCFGLQRRGFDLWWRHFGGSVLLQLLTSLFLFPLSQEKPGYWSLRLLLLTRQEADFPS